MRVMQQLQDDTSGGGGGAPDLSSGNPNWLSGSPTSPNITDPSNSQWAPYPSMGQGAMPGYSPQPNNWLSDVNNFLGTPTGTAAAGAGVGLYGLITAKQAQNNAQKLTGAISGTALPGQQVSNATYRQLTGGAPVGGPMGTYIAGTTSAANQLAQTAGQYATGQLTPAQQLQVKQNQAAQNAQFMTGMGGPGQMGLDSSAAAMMRQQNANNAAMLTQTMEQNNIALATAALQGATQTYDQLLTSALNQANLGYQATANAVKQQLTANTQVATAINDILKSIVSGYVSAQQPQQQPGGGGGQATGGGAVASPSLMSMAGTMMGKGLQGMAANNQAQTNAGNIQQDVTGMTDQASQDIASTGVQPLNLTDMSTDYG